MKQRYDAIVIGGGHNGTTAAAYMGMAGKKVAVFEARDVLGGCAVTEEIWPGYKVSPLAYVLSLVPTQLINDLRLKENGLEVIPRVPFASYTPDPTMEGPGLLLGPNDEMNYHEIAMYNGRDAEHYQEYNDQLSRIASGLEPIIENMPPSLLNTAGRKLGLFETVGEAYKAFKLARGLQAMGDDLPDAVDLMTGAASTYLDRHFESEILKTTLATDAVIGSFTTPSQQGSAYVLFHHVMGEAGGQRGIWAQVRGGIGGLTEAIANSATQMGVEIYIEQKVREIKIENGRVTGVVLDNGQEFDAPVVASSIDPYHTFRVLSNPSVYPEAFSKRVADLDYGAACSKISFALDSLPRFVSTVDRGDPATYLTGTTHIPHNREGIEKAFDQAKYGLPSERPLLEIVIPSVLDPTITPEGKHLMSVLAQYTPYKVEGGWDKHKERFMDRVMDIIEENAPGFKSSVIERHGVFPDDMEKIYGLHEGNIFQGNMRLGQMLTFRPVPGWSDHKTPIKGLYVVGSAAHPGGGITCMPGRNGAQVILKDGLI